MKAGYKVVNYIFKNDKILVVSNLPLNNRVLLASEKDEKTAKKDKDDFDIGFWRIKRK